MEKNKEDGMTDLEIVKECLITLNREAPFCAKMIEGAEAAERMAAEIERLQNENVNLEAIGKTFQSNELAALQKLRAALTENIELRTEIERLKAEIIEANKKAKDQGRTACNLFDELKKLQKENRELEAALAEKPDVVFCKDCIIFQNCFIQKGYKLEFCSFGRKEAKDED